MKEKIEITQKQAKQFNEMREALITISSHYDTPARLKKQSNKDYGLDFEEAIEMAYENIQNLAKMSIKGVNSLYH